MTQSKDMAEPGGGALERLEVMGTSVLAQYDRIVSILGMELTESQLGLLAKPVLDEAGQLLRWTSRDGAELTPSSALPEADRAALEARRDRIVEAIDQMIGRLRARGAPGMVTAEVLNTALTLPGDRETLYSDGDGPVLVDWGSRPAPAPAGDLLAPREGSDAALEAVPGVVQGPAEPPPPAPSAVEPPLPEPALPEPTLPEPPRAETEIPPEPLPEPLPEPPVTPPSAPRARSRLNLTGRPPEPEGEAAPPRGDETGEDGTGRPRHRPLFAPALRAGETATGEPPLDGGRPALRLQPSAEDRSGVPEAAEEIVAERDDAFLRRQWAERTRRKVEARAGRRRTAGPRRLEDDGNPLVWLLPALLLGFGTFFLFRSPEPESLIGRVFNPETTRQIASVIEHLTTPRFADPGVGGADDDPPAGQQAPEDGASETDSEVITLLNEGSVSGVPVPSGRLTTLWSRDLMPCFALPPGAVPEETPGSVTIRIGIEGDGSLFSPPDLRSPKPMTDAVRPIYSAGVAAILACEPLPAETGPAVLDITFGPTGLRSVKVVRRGGAGG